MVNYIKVICKVFNTAAMAKKKVCLRSTNRPEFLAPTLKFFMALLVEIHTNTLILPSNVVFDVEGIIIFTKTS